MVKVRFYAAARAATGVSEVEIQTDSLGDLKAKLAIDFPAFHSVLAKCSFLVNEISQRDAAMQLNPGDTVDVLPPFAGGSR